jgi:hypothetical protein
MSPLSAHSELIHESNVRVVNLVRFCTVYGKLGGPHAIKAKTATVTV